MGSVSSTSLPDAAVVREAEVVAPVLRWLLSAIIQLDRALVALLQEA